MADRKLGKTGVDQGSYETTYFECGTRQGWFSKSQRNWGTPRVSRNRPEFLARVREEEDRVSRQISNMKECGCARPADWEFEQPQPAKKKAVAPQAPAASTAGKTSLIEDLAALTRLWEQGALTDDEFAAAKATVLGVSSPPNSP